ncbi:hypothetical protein [Helicobacter trogontum]|uniref:Saposin B-type domain-containing protein n=1 Tax=Helicobacter trogontum TaxID=50960 RepID=A0A099VCW8_9HELI|nr:hypothetical protein [Helicobacter trogontum]TLD84629.1 hypothetical protein LS81_001055 [Helicobacter trogontum]
MRYVSFVCFTSAFFAINAAFCVPVAIQNDYDNICWNCYSPEIAIQNFLSKYREPLRNLCFKKDAKACEMMATLNSALQNDIDAQDYYQMACKLGVKDSCARVDIDEE